MLHSILLERGWLALQPESFQQAVVAAGQILHFEGGETIFSVGDPPGGAYAILRGAAAIEIAPARDGPHFVHVSAPGAWLGEISFFTGEKRRITFRTVAAADLFFLPLDAMERLSKHDSEAMRRFAQITAQNVDTTFRKIEILLDPDPMRRIAGTLLQCRGEMKRGPIFLSQADLGRMANVSRNTVVRTLKEFSQRGWLRPGYARIEILEPSKLDRFNRKT
ncbi:MULTISPECIES: Crp/Fnr family transcriptional regulator [unclassified Ruegeria]|uniref:Crp/Fnr family transcriptional regulator n=1 Tax=unclassified Ruegeria TaxID=2625375 RepID=UPI001492A481|nr:MULTISPECIES: Crp/Fnr family transcriptional regulator [unclassified Ruegeria]NOD86600.1 cyclic nucleotide-binding domain-containing protein [Ruegeria sp. HKCCD6119]